MVDVVLIAEPVCIQVGSTVHNVTSASPTSKQLRQSHRGCRLGQYIKMIARCCHSARLHMSKFHTSWESEVSCLYATWSSKSSSQSERSSTRLTFHRGCIGLQPDKVLSKCKTTEHVMYPTTSIPGRVTHVCQWVSYSVSQFLSKIVSLRQALSLVFLLHPSQYGVPICMKRSESALARDSVKLNNFAELRCARVSSVCLIASLPLYF